MGQEINSINTTTLFYANNKLVGLHDPIEGQCIAIKPGQQEVMNISETEANKSQGSQSNLAFWLFGSDNKGITGCGTSSTPASIDYDSTIQTKDAQSDEINMVDVEIDITPWPTHKKVYCEVPTPVCDKDGYNSVPFGGSDCDDNDPFAHPGAKDLFCDGFDYDCDGLDKDIDKDIDKDGFDGCKADCNDLDPKINPMASDFFCDGIDFNCDNLDKDVDKDGYDGCKNDCDDSNLNINPGAVEIECDSIDQDCNGIDKCSIDCDLNKPGIQSFVKIGENVNITSFPATQPNGQASFLLDPSLAWTGSLFGVAWQGHISESNGGNFFDRFDKNGKKIGNTSIIESFGGASYGPELIWTGEEFGICWAYPDQNIKFTKIGLDGNKPIGNISLTGNGTYGTSNSPSLVWTGKEFGISWDDSKNKTGQIYFIRVDSNGNKIGEEVNVSDNNDWAGGSSLVWNGTNFAVIWMANSQLFFGRIDKNGKKIGNTTKISSPPLAPRKPSLVWNGFEYAATWANYSPPPPLTEDLYFTRIDINGQNVGDIINVSKLSSPGIIMINSSLLSINTKYAIAWRQINFDPTNGGDSNIYFTGINSDSTETGNILKVSAGAKPSLAWTGSEYGLVFSMEVDTKVGIYFSRIGCQ